MKSLLITGGTGTLGSALIKHLVDLDSYDRLIVFSRDELKQSELQASLMHTPNRSKLRYFLGDVRDLERLKQAMNGVNNVIHAAALKRIDAVNYNPQEAVKTNILGSDNVITAAIQCGVERCLAVSTDKAVNPTTLYGTTKLLMEQLWQTAPARAGKLDIRFPIIRYGNVPLVLVHDFRTGAAEIGMGTGLCCFSTKSSQWMYSNLMPAASAGVLSSNDSCGRKKL